MPFQKISDLDLEYGLISFDGDGRERADDPVGGVFSRALTEKVKSEQPTDVFLFSHGWKGDVPAAVDQYNRWIGAMWKDTADRAAMGPDFRPLFIGLHWPSLPWGEETMPAAAAFGTAAGVALDVLLEAAVQHFGGSAAVRPPLEVIFRAFEQNPAAKVLPEEVVSAYHDLAAAIGFSAGSGADAAPDHEGVKLDPQAAVQAEKIASVGNSFGIGSVLKGGILAGLRQPSFWLMKHRARAVGEGGMHQFVAQVQGVSSAAVHLMGHSFGCIVASSILGGSGGKQRLPRPVESVALVQGALSLWSFADQLPDATGPGYFRDVLNKGAVSGPVVSTQSTHDLAVGLAYPAAVGLVDEIDFAANAILPKFGGVGTWGIQGTASTAGATPMLNADKTYGLEAERVYNLDGSSFISGHSAIDGPEVAHLLWQAASVGQAVAKGQHA